MDEKRKQEDDAMIHAFYYEQEAFISRVVHSRLDPLDKLFTLLLLHNNIKRFITPQPGMPPDVREFLEQSAKATDLLANFEADKSN
jgi:hypothetical protein